MTTTQNSNTTEATESKEDKLFSDTNVNMKTGHLVRDAEIIGKGKFAKIVIATNRDYKDAKGQIKTITNYFNALVSSNLKEAFKVAKALKKGDWVYLKGEDHSETFDTPEGFKKRSSTLFAYKAVLKSAKADNPSPD